MCQEHPDESVGRESGSFEESRKEEAANAPQESSELEITGEETATGDEKSPPEKSELRDQGDNQPVVEGSSASPKEIAGKKKPEKKPRPAKKATEKKPHASSPPDTPIPSVDGKTRNLKPCSLEQLGEAANAEYLLIEEFGKKTAIHTYRLGRLLTVAFAKVKAGEWALGKTWAEFLKRYCISTATDNRARHLYKRAGSEKAVAELTITEAYELFGIDIRGKKNAAHANDADEIVDDTGAAFAGEQSSAAETRVIAPPPKEPIYTFEYGLASVESFFDGLIDKVAFKPPIASEKQECLKRLDRLESLLKQIRELLEEEGDVDANS